MGLNEKFFASATAGPIVPAGNIKLDLDASDINSYPGNGTTWFDLTANNNDGTISGATWNPGGYFIFNGSTSIVTVPANVTNTNAVCTIEAWAQGSSFSNAGNDILWQTANGGFYTAIITETNSFRVYLRDSSNTTSFPIAYALSNFNTTDWYHIVITYGGLNGTVTAYVDGNIVDTGSVPSSIKTYTSNNTIGGEIGNTNLGWNGQISKVRIYNIVLTPTQVQALHAEGR